MEWVTVSKDVGDALKELDEGGDRAAAIVAAALVEEHLTTALESYLHQHPKVTKGLFRISGPLGSFGAKIDLALLVGMFGPASHKELDTIKDIRNLFAHNLRLKGFATQRIKDLVSNLNRYESRFEVKIARAEGEPYWLLYVPPEPSIPPPSTRERYIHACRYYTAILTTQISRDRPSVPRAFF
jgi:hypothetical protein